MTVQVPIHDCRRLVPVSFRRATTGAPDPLKPSVDDRGFGAEHAPVVGIKKNETVIVHVVRELLDRDAPLHATSSDPDVATVVGTGKLLAGGIVDLSILGRGGGSPAKATIEVRYRDASGPIVGQLAAWVYSPIKLVVKPHVLKIGAPGAPAVPAVGPKTKAAELISAVNDIWRQAAIEFVLLKEAEHTETLTAAGKISTEAQLAALLHTHHVDNAINLFLAHRCAFALGMGVSRSALTDPSLGLAAQGFTDPGIVITDEDDGSGTPLDDQLKASVLAHELGHFLQLWHPEKKNADAPRTDLWSRRMLMFPTQLPDKLADWRDQIGYGTFSCKATGITNELRQGAHLTHKHLPKLTTDGEVATARLATVDKTKLY